MQGFFNASKRLYRYGRTVTEDVNGVATETYVRATSPRWMNIIPNSSARSKQEYGISEEVTYLIIINDCHDYKIGDRIGNESKMLYEVISVQTYMTNQQLTVRECQISA